MLESFANWLITNGADESNKEVYIYGMECIINEIITDFLLIVFGCIMGNVASVVIWLGFFTLIRVNLGGYHSRTQIRCIISSTFMGCFCLLILPYLKEIKKLTIFCSFFSMIIIFKIAPVMHHNHPVPKAKIPSIKYKATLFALMELIIIIFSPETDMYLPQITFTALFSSTLLGLAGHIKNRTTE